MWWIPAGVAAFLALCGWGLILHMAKRREAYDLYLSALSLLEQMDADGREAWEDDMRYMDQYTEWKLSSKVADLERRIGLIKKYYPPVKPTQISPKQIKVLRKLLTAKRGSLFQPGAGDRSIDIHHLTNDMKVVLLEEVYAYINRRPWVPF